MQKVGYYFRLQSNQKVRNYYSKRISDVLWSLTGENNRLFSFKQIKQDRQDSLFFLTTLTANNKNLLFQFVPSTLPPEKRLERRTSGFSKIILRSAMPFDAVAFIKNLITKEINIRTSGIFKEDRVLAVLQEIKKEGLIRDAYKSTEHQDIGGTDHFVQLNDEFSTKMPLQVKSDYAAQKIHQEKYPDKPSIRISFQTTNAVIKKKLILIIENYKKGTILHI